MTIRNSKFLRHNTDRKAILRMDNDISIHKGIWVFIEIEEKAIAITPREKSVAKVSLELISEARKLASKLDTEVSAILLGHEVEGLAQTILSYGVDNIYLIDHPSLCEFNDERYAKAIIELVNRYRPDIFLLGATVRGRSLAPRIASALNTGLTADCTQLDIDPEKKILLQTRPAFGGDLMATIICPECRPQMATVRPGVFEVSKYEGKMAGKIIKPEITIFDSKIEILQYIQDTTESFDISEVDIIVAAGRGLGEKKNLKLVEELASMIGGQVGASRAIVEAGWIDRSHQIGQSGNTVSPKLYIACGISGAIQHMVGLKSPGIIIAINKDINAPIMKAANYAFVGDAVEILTMIINEIKKRGVISRYK